MFYTKYRPQTFSQISQPNEAADALAKQISTNKTAHAYLFVGPRGTGKTSTARILAKALNCLNLQPNGDPCDNCDNCNAVKTGSLTDLIEIDAASNRGIEDIRELQSKISLAPVQGKNKIYIIDEVHMLTMPAFNALLKTLEEPPVHVTFILCTTELNKVPDTIKSRCQVFKFKRATLPQLTTKLRFIAESEGHTLEESAFASIAQYSLGGFRDAETLLQQILEGGLDTATVLGKLNATNIFTFIDFLHTKDSEGAISLLNIVYQDGTNLSVWLGDVISHLRNVLLLKSGFSKEYFGLSDDVMVLLISQSQQLNISWIVSTLDTLLLAYEKVEKSFIPQLPIEIAIVNICNSASVITMGTVATPNPIKPIKTSDGNGPKSVTPNKTNDEKPATDKKLSETVTSKLEAAPQVTVSVEAVELHNILGDSLIEIGVIESKWEIILEKAKDVNGPILAMLRSAKPISVRDKFIVLEVYFAFHKERLESTKNRQILEDVLKDVFGIALSFICEINQEKPQKLKDREVGILTDANVVPVDSGDIMNVFDGGLPL